MNKETYLSDIHLQNFVNWIENKIDEPNSFIHKYEMLKPKKKWNCNSIYNAFEKYEWSGKNFQESSILLNELSKGLQKSIVNRDEVPCKEYCLKILKWGGVSNGNKDTIEGLFLKGQLTDYFARMENLLNSNTLYPNNVGFDKAILMNSGFTKIYALFLYDFIIYDGRVGAALGLLVSNFCREKELLNIPQSLIFAYGDARPTKLDTGLNRRNPSSDIYQFPKLSNNAIKHTEYNLKANWLLKEIIEKTDTKFKKLDKEIQLRAFESSLFMIGYDVKVKF